MIVLFHTNLFTTMFKPLVNQAVVEQKIYPRVWYQLILQSYFGVDSFFLLSGTLAAYNTFALMDRRKSTWFSRFPFFRFYIHRYIRLTPNLAFVLLLQYLTVHFTKGPLTIDTSSQTNDNCDRYWWSKLIYISTLYPSIYTHLCQSWTWHFSNDMQFYVIAPLVLIPMYYSFCSGLVVTVAMLAVSFTITGVIAGTNDVSPFYFNRNLSPQLITDLNLIYIKSYCRIPPFLVGIVLGYLLYNKFHVPSRGTMKYLFVIAMWVVALAIFTAILFGLYPTWQGHVLSTIENIAFYTLSRFAWGVALAIVIFTCHNGYGGIVNRFLSMKLWIPLSRLTYSVSLINPIILNIIFDSRRQVDVYEDIKLLMLAISTTVLSLAAAVALILFIEFPMSNIEALLFKTFTKQHRRTANFAIKEAINKKE